MTDWADEKAREIAGLAAAEWSSWTAAPIVRNRDQLALAIAAALREERERCAQVADAHHETYEGSSADVDKGHAWAAQDIAAAIRGETP